MIPRPEPASAARVAIAESLSRILKQPNVEQYVEHGVRREICRETQDCVNQATRAFPLSLRHWTEHIVCIEEHMTAVPQGDYVRLVRAT